MKHNKYDVVLTNGMVNHTYSITAFNEREAVILAQAEAIRSARGYDFVSITIQDKPDAYAEFFGKLVPIKIVRTSNRYIEVKPLQKITIG